MSKTRKVLSEGIASQESKGTGGYKAKNPKSSAVGKYQFLWKQWGNKIKQFSGNPNLTEDDFKNDPQLQDAFMEDYRQKVLIPESEKLQKRHGDKFKERGIETLEDAQTLIHFQGYPGAAYFLKTGESKFPENNKPVSDYIDEAKKQRKLLRERANQVVDAGDLP